MRRRPARPPAPEQRGRRRWWLARGDGGHLRRRGLFLARGDAGQATVEFVALLPVLVLLALAAWQAAVAGQAAWLAAGAARAAARAAAVGADPADAARSTLPPALRRGLEVDAGDPVVVRVRVRSIVGGRHLATIRARAAFPEQTS